MAIDIMLLAKSIGEIAAAIDGTLKIADKLSNSKFLFYKKTAINEMKGKLTMVSAKIGKIGEISDGLRQYGNYIVSFNDTNRQCYSLKIQVTEHKKSLENKDDPYWNALTYQFDNIYKLRSKYLEMQNGHGLFFNENDYGDVKPVLDEFFEGFISANTNLENRSCDGFSNSLEILCKKSEVLSNTLKRKMDIGLKEIKDQSEIIKSKSEISDSIGGN